MDRHSYQERTYRKRLSTHGLTSFHVQVRETDLYIAAATDLTVYTYDVIHQYRHHLDNYIKFHPDFRTALTPLPADRAAESIDLPVWVRWPLLPEPSPNLWVVL